MAIASTPIPVCAGFTLMCRRCQMIFGLSVEKTARRDFFSSIGVHLESSNPGLANAGSSPPKTMPLAPSAKFPWRFVASKVCARRGRNTPEMPSEQKRSTAHWRDGRRSTLKQAIRWTKPPGDFSPPYHRVSFGCQQKSTTVAVQVEGAEEAQAPHRRDWL